MASSIPFEVRLQALATITAGMLAGGENLQDRFLAARAVKILAALELADKQSQFAEPHRTNHGAF